MQTIALDLHDISSNEKVENIFEIKKSLIKLLSLNLLSMNNQFGGFVRKYMTKENEAGRIYAEMVEVFRE